MATIKKYCKNCKKEFEAKKQSRGWYSSYCSKCSKKKIWWKTVSKKIRMKDFGFTDKEIREYEESLK